MPSKKRRIGDVGEKVALSFLKQNGHAIVTTNYQKYSGEIDIISRENKTIHFVEVKMAFIPARGVSRETFIRPEDRVTRSKIRKIEKTALYFLEEFHYQNMAWTIDVIAVYIFQKRRRGRRAWLNGKPNYYYLFKTVYLQNVY